MNTREKEDKDNIEECDLYLMSANINEIEQRVLDQTRNAKTPILTKDNNLYGDTDGDDNWKFTKITQGLDELQQLPFKNGILRRSDPKFTSSLINTLKPGHFYFKTLNEQLAEATVGLKRAIEDYNNQWHVWWNKPLPPISVCLSNFFNRCCKRKDAPKTPSASISFKNR